MSRSATGSDVDAPDGASWLLSGQTVVLAEVALVTSVPVPNAVAVRTARAAAGPASRLRTRPTGARKDTWVPPCTNHPLSRPTGPANVWKAYPSGYLKNEIRFTAAAGGRTCLVGGGVRQRACVEEQVEVGVEASTLLDAGTPAESPELATSQRRLRVR